MSDLGPHVTENFGEKYVRSLFWSIGVVTMFGTELYPVTATEMIFNMISMILAACIFANFISSVTAGALRSAFSVRTWFLGVCSPR